MNKLSLPVLLITSFLIIGCGGGGGNTSTGSGTGTGSGSGSEVALEAPGPYVGTGIRSPRLKKITYNDGIHSPWTTSITYGGTSGTRANKLVEVGSPDTDDDGFGDSDQTTTNIFTAGGLIDRAINISSKGDKTEIIYNYGTVIFSPTLNPAVSSLEIITNDSVVTIEHTYHLKDTPQFGLVATKLVSTSNSLGQSSKYFYNSDGFLKEVNNIDTRIVTGRKLIYSYNSLNQLVKVESPPETSQLFGEIGNKKELAYNDNGLLVTIREYDWERGGNPDPFKYSWQLKLTSTAEYENGNVYYFQPPDFLNILKYQ